MSIRHQATSIALLLLLAAAARAQTVNVTITTDNAYSFGYGTASGLTNLFGGIENTTAGAIFNCSNGPENYPSVPYVANGFLYVIAYSDEASTQGVLGQFVSGTKTIFTGTSGWQVYATGLDFDPGSGGPSLSTINAQIALANAGTGGAGSSRGWVGPNGGPMSSGYVGTLATGEANDSATGSFPQVCPSSANPSATNAIKDAARWMWYNPSGLANPFSGTVAGEFLIFRLPFGEVVTPRRVIVNKDINNTTGQTATGVDILIAGHHSQINDIFHGTTPNFTVVQSGPNDLLRWSGGNIAPGATVHVGFNMPEASVDILGVFMTDNGVVIGCAHQLNSNLHIYGFGGEITYTNSVTACESVPLYVHDISVEYYENEVDLALLNPTSPRSPIRVDRLPIPAILINPGASAKAATPATDKPKANYALVRYTVSTTPGGPGTEDFVEFPLPPSPPAAGSCASSVTALCLNDNRFRVTVAWEDFSGNTGSGQAVALTDDTGYFWFFGADNVELVLKVLDGRGVNNHFWVFYGALSSVEYTITVTDTATGAVRTYRNPSGTLASAADTQAF
ncbi:MAG TPA: hypothetical protein VFS60_16775 [Thermoanaerobaculia bacterium]|nr:hypothetical protein [Thermoanaerobaculia bacterium]